MDINLTLAELPYQKDALNPFITEETIDYHYGIHKASYVNNLRALVSDTELMETSIENKFSETAIKIFGAGWASLAQKEHGILEIVAKDAYSPLIENKKPILTLDVWEHAYYIDYRNARPKFVKGFWEVVNWNFANRNLI